MAFAFRKIISNIGYFKKPGDDENSALQPQSDPESNLLRHETHLEAGDAEFINFECTEPDSTSIQNTIEFPPSFNESIKTITVQKTSLSDTDLLTINPNKSKEERKKAKKLKLDIKKANQSFDDSYNRDTVENTPKHVLLECKSSEIFSERMKKFNFSKSFEIDDSDTSSYEEENYDIESLSEDEVSIETEESNGSIKMCRKVSAESQESLHIQLVPSVTPESFADVEVDKNEEERMSLLCNYQIKFEKLECLLKKLLTEFQFHIEVSKIFHLKSFASTLSDTDVSKLPKILGEGMYVDTISRGISPTGSWNIIMEKEDEVTKNKLKHQLLRIQHTLNDFINTYLSQGTVQKPKLARIGRSITFDLKRNTKKCRMSNKKKIKHFDYPDIREAMLNLFATETEPIDISSTSADETDKCVCRCHENSTSDTDSGLKMKSEDRSMSITSSIGNFTLDTSTLTAYSESLEQIISYNSFQDTSLYSTFLQKAAIERITFYVQAHSIQLKCETPDDDYESKNTITFHCPSCKATEYEENGLLKHILSQSHCEKIHFLYKTAYIKKCVAAGKEIQPSTVLNPMKMYRDENKIVCFGDAIYACSLCFENVIIGESVLMAHCADPDHVEKREKLAEILD